MLTVASPRMSDVELDLRARSLQADICANPCRRKRPGHARGRFPPPFPRMPFRRSPAGRRLFRRFRRHAMATSRGAGLHGPRPAPTHDDATLIGSAQAIRRDNLQRFRDPSRYMAALRHSRSAADAGALTEDAGEKFSYRELDDFTDLIQRHLQSVPLVLQGHSLGRACRGHLPRLFAGES